MGHIDNAKREKLVEGLVKKTLDKDVSWHEDGAGGDYAIDFPRSSVVLRLYSKNDRSRKHMSVNFDIVDSMGEVVDSIYLNDVLKKNPELSKELSQLSFAVDGDPGETFFRLVESQVRQSRIEDVYDDVLSHLAM